MVLAGSTLEVKVIGQMSRSQGLKNVIQWGFSTFRKVKGHRVNVKGHGDQTSFRSRSRGQWVKMLFRGDLEKKITRKNS